MVDPPSSSTFRSWSPSWEPCPAFGSWLDVLPQPHASHEDDGEVVIDENGQRSLNGRS